MLNSISAKKTNNGPLSGVRVLDLSRILAGPTCTQLLGDMGADIIKIEKPVAGDDTRSWGPPFVLDKDNQPTDQSAYYLCANRNKRSLSVDISSLEGRAIIHDLLNTCDILVENFKVGGLKKYGLDYASLKIAYPELIYCSITGFGQTGPNAQRPGYDLLAQGFGGIMSLTGEAEGEPMKVGVGICDVMTGMYANSAVLAALFYRQNGGTGQQIDIALVDVQTAWLVNEGTNYLLSGHEPERRGNAHPNIVPYQVFSVSDGHVIVAVGNDPQFQRFCNIVNRPELAKDTRFKTNSLRLEHRQQLIDILTVIMRKQVKQDLIESMEKHGIPSGPINTVAELFASDQVVAREMKITMPYPSANSGTVDLIGNPIKFSKTPIEYRHAPPKCGEHDSEILAEINQHSGFVSATQKPLKSD